MYVFGDGASAVVLKGDGVSGEGILASMSGNAYGDLVHRKGGGLLKLAHQGRATPADHAFIVDGQLVARTYPAYMAQRIDVATENHTETSHQVKCYYFHQPNKPPIDFF